MNINIRIGNIIVGMVLLMTSLLTVIPMTVRIIKVGPQNGFNFGFLLLPFVLPLSLMSVTGLLVFLNKQKLFYWIKRMLIAIYALVAVILFGSSFMIPSLWIFALLTIIPLYISTRLEKDELGKYFLIHNGFVAILNFLILVLVVDLNGSNKIMELLELWK